MLSRYFLILSILFVGQGADAQLLFEGNKGRFNFAQMSLGLEYQQSSLELPSSHGNGRLDMSSYYLNIGGWHFWGLADFWVQFPIEKFDRQYQSNRYQYSSGVETGFKLYPMRLKSHAFRPFLGSSFQFSHLQINDGPKDYRQRNPILLGLSYATPKYQLDIGSRYFVDNTFNYATSQSDFETVRVNPVSWFLGLKTIADTTAFGARQAIKPLKRGTYPFLGIGFSSAWTTHQRSSLIDREAPWMDTHPNSQTFPEFSLGTHWKLNQPLNQRVILQISYRQSDDSLSAYGQSFKFTNSSIATELAYSFLDYHGFVPYLGVSLNQASLSIKHQGKRYSDTVQNLGLLMGWDIIPNGGQSAWLLRTNLRWYPQNKLETEDGDVHFSNVEFNFIQWIYQFNTSI